MTMQELVARLEAATGPDRELDRAILLAAEWQIDKEAFGIAAASEIWISPAGEDIDAVVGPSMGGRGLPSPTSSLDAAVQLVPNGYGWRVDGATIAGRKFESWVGANKATGATAAIALCTAALKARSQP